MNGLLSNPWVNIGLGILAANKPGVGAGQAIGEGGLLGMQNFQAMQQAEYERKLKEQQAELERQKLIAEQEQQRQQIAARQQLLSQVPPDMVPWVQAGMEKQVFGQMHAKPTLHSFQQGSENMTMMWDPASRQYVPIASGPKWNPNSGMGLRVGPDGTIEFGTGQGMPQRSRGSLYQPMDKTEARKIRAEVREYDKIERDANDLLEYMQRNPGAAGALPRAKKFVGSWMEQVGDFLGMPTLQQTGAELSGELALYKLKARTLVQSSKALLMDNQGRLSDKDQRILDEANQALEAATTDREVKLVVRDLQNTARVRAQNLGYDLGGARQTPPAGEPSDDDLLQMMQEDILRNQ